MNEFVTECLSEWKRLGVADAVAAEMAAELTADLAEAAAEGATAEAVLGTSAFEPRTFAKAWATERGAVPPAASAPPAVPEPVAALPPAPVASRTTSPWRSRRRWVPLLVAVFALVGVFGASLAFSSSRETRAVMVKPVPLNPDGSPDLKPLPDLKRLVPPAIKAVPRFVVPGPGDVMSIDHRGRNVRVLGFLLIVIGIGGVALIEFRRAAPGKRFGAGQDVPMVRGT